MELVLTGEPLAVVEEVNVGEPDHLGEGERCDTDAFLPKAVGSQREVSSLTDGQARGVEGLLEGSLMFWCWTPGHDSWLRARTKHFWWSVMPL